MSASGAAEKDLEEKSAEDRKSGKQKTIKIKNILTASFNVVGLDEIVDKNKDKEIVVYITTEDNEDDWETYSFTEYGETKEIIIPEGGYVSLTISAIITLEPLSE